MRSLATNITGIACEISGHPCVTYLDDVKLSDGLLSGSIKNAAVIACADMGASVPYLCSSPGAELYLFQNFGHQFDSADMVETIVESDVRNVIVYGHSDCQYMKFIARQKDREEARREDIYAAWKSVGQYNVLNELKKMLVDPDIAHLVKNGNINLHGWFHDATAGRIEVFDPKKQAFIPVIN
jgi:carbonic anhydrase